MDYLVVFRARSETMKFNSILSSYKIKSIIVNTPRQISVACGISIKISGNALNVAKDIIRRRQFYTFAGIFMLNNTNYLLL